MNKNRGTLSPTGIDKSIIKPIITAFNYEKLSKLSNKVLDTTGITLPIIDSTTGEYIEVSNLVINDGYVFKDFRSGVNVTNNNFIRYNKLDLSKMGTDDNNLIPYNMATYKQHADRVIGYMSEIYGIELDKNDLKGEVLELNTNIILDRPFKEYDYMLNIIADVCKGGKHRFKSQITKGEDGGIETVILFNKSNISLKIYNKKLQLEEVKQQYINNEIMRIELTLKRQEAIEELFGTCYINELTDEQINEVFTTFVKVNIFDKMDKYIKDTDKELKKILKTEKEKDSRKWRRGFLLKGGYVAFDIQQILDLIRNENKKNYATGIKKLQTDIEDLTGLHDNLLKFSEIKNKLSI